MEFKIFVSTVIEQDGKILLVQEAKEINFEKWNLPGGHLELTEKAFEGAKREALEETFLDVEITSFLGVYSSLGNNHSFRYTFIGKIIGGEAKAGDQILAVKWWDPAELVNLDKEHFVTPRVLEAIAKDYLSGARYPVDVVKEVGKHS